MQQLNDLLSTISTAKQTISTAISAAKQAAPMNKNSSASMFRRPAGSIRPGASRRLAPKPGQKRLAATPRAATSVAASAAAAASAAVATFRGMPRGKMAKTTYAMTPVKGTARRPGQIRISGREWLGSLYGGTSGGSILPPILAGTASAKGTLLYTANVNPNFGPLRLRAQAQFYEKYHFNTFRIVLKGTMANTVAGSCAGAFDMDPADSIGGGNAAYLAISSQPGAGHARYFDESVAWSLPKGGNTTSDGGLYTSTGAGSETRLVNQATFNLVVEAPVNAEGGSSTPGNTVEVADLWAEYVCDLWAPTTESEAVGTTAPVIFGASSAGLTDLNNNNVNSPMTSNGNNTFANVQLIYDPSFVPSGVSVPSIAADTTATDHITFPASWPAAYVQFWTHVSSGTGSSITLSANANCAVLTSPWTGFTTYIGNAGTTGSSSIASAYFYQVNPSQAWSIHVTGASASTPTYTARFAIAAPFSIPGDALRKMRSDAKDEDAARRILAKVRRLAADEKYPAHVDSRGFVRVEPDDPDIEMLSLDTPLRLSRTSVTATAPRPVSRSLK